MGVKAEGPADSGTPRQREAGEKQKEGIRDGETETERDAGRGRDGGDKSRTPGHKTTDGKKRVDGQRRTKEMDRERSEQIGQSVGIKEKVQTWGGGRDSGLGDKVALTEPPPPYPHRRPAPPPPSPQLAPSSEAKRWGGAARQMVGSTGMGRELGWNASGRAAGGEGLGGGGWGRRRWGANLDGERGGRGMGGWAVRG